MKRKITAALAAVALATGGALYGAFPAFAESDPLPICHSGSGTNWTYIAPDANGYNGHQHHDADIVGLSEAECLAKNVVIEEPEEPPVEEPVDVDYVLTAWLAGDAPPNHFAIPQTYLFSEHLEDGSLSALDDEIAAYLATLPCGTDADIQVDLYLDDATTAALILGALLNGPNDPTEHLAYGAVSGNPWKFVHLDAPACEEEPPPPTVVTPDVPTFLDDCEGYTLTVPEDTAAIDYTVEIDTELKRIRVVAVAIGNNVLASGEDKDVWHFSYTDEECPVEEPPVEEEPPVIPPTELPTPEVLAHTGVNDENPAAAIAAVLLALGVIFMGAHAIRKHAIK